MRPHFGVVWRFAFPAAMLAFVMLMFYFAHQQRKLLDERLSRLTVSLGESQRELLRRHHIVASGAVVWLDLKGRHLADDDLDVIASFTDLYGLDLSETNITDEQLASLKKLSSLHVLRLNKTKLTGAAIPQLEAIPNLTRLEIEGCDILALVIGQLKRQSAGHYTRMLDWAARNKVDFVQLPVDRFLLMRSGKLRMALKFTKASAERGAEYVCYWQPAPEGPFESGSLRSSKGELFERSLYVGPKDGDRQAIDLGGKREIQCGPVKLTWSSQTTVYVPRSKSSYEPPWDVALTRWSELKDVDFQWNGLQWCRGPQADYHDRPFSEPDRFFWGHVVHAPLQRFVLLRRGTDRMAVMLGRCLTEVPDGWGYICYWQPDAKAVFAAEKTLKKREGRLFEKHRVIQRRASSELWEDAGSQLNVDCGPLKLVWSSPTSLYFPEVGAKLPALEMAETTWTCLEEIDFEMKGLKWYEREQVTGAGQSATRNRRSEHAPDCLFRHRGVDLPAHRQCGREPPLNSRACCCVQEASGNRANSARTLAGSRAWHAG